VWPAGVMFVGHGFGSSMVHMLVTVAIEDDPLDGVVQCARMFTKMFPIK